MVGVYTGHGDDQPIVLVNHLDAAGGEAS